MIPKVVLPPSSRESPTAELASWGMLKVSTSTTSALPTHDAIMIRTGKTEVKS
nr:hypothetical protein [Nocardioides sambongensis]